MTKLIKIPLVFVLITTLMSFGFVAVILPTQLGQDGYVSSGQMYAVIAICAVATLCSLGMLALLALDLLGKSLPARLAPIANKILVIVGLVFCGLAIYAFTLVPTEFFEDYLLRFSFSARIEFLMVGLTSLAISAMRKWSN